ncbi:hypothetical protein G6F35_015660 [Rhizopus arrhizus]|nr:hypothetical protein G6F35_015660 [Rhizopus arrhizus]
MKAVAAREARLDERAHQLAFHAVGVFFLHPDTARHARHVVQQIPQAAIPGRAPAIQEHGCRQHHQRATRVRFPLAQFHGQQRPQAHANHVHHLVLPTKLAIALGHHGHPVLYPHIQQVFGLSGVAGQGHAVRFHARARQHLVQRAHIELRTAQPMDKQRTGAMRPRKVIHFSPQKHHGWTNAAAHP